MKQFIMTEQQKGIILQALGELPLKVGFNAAFTLQSLPLYVEKIEVPEEPVEPSDS